jgi:hypothetical protein
MWAICWLDCSSSGSRAVHQAFSRRPVTTTSRDPAQASLCGICGRHIGCGRGFFFSPGCGCVPLGSILAPVLHFVHSIHSFITNVLYSWQTTMLINNKHLRFPKTSRTAAGQYRLHKNLFWRYCRRVLWQDLTFWRRNYFLNLSTPCI